MKKNIVSKIFSEKVFFQALLLTLGMALLLYLFYIYINPTIFVSFEDAKKIEEFQSEFSINYQCRKYMMDCKERRYKGPKDLMYVHMDSGRSLNSINQDIVDILKKYPYVPNFLFKGRYGNVPGG